MRFHVASKARKLFFTKEEKPVNGKNPDAGLDLKCNSPVDFGFDCRSFGSKEENFFDSRPWLDSDCEDDFYSVNGEFTPSRGTTPNYQIGTPRLEPFFIDKFPDSKSEISPTGRKKLADLFQETMQGEKEHDEQDSANIREKLGKVDVHNIKGDASPKSLNGTPHSLGSNSIISTEDTPNGHTNKKKVKIVRMDCCLPSLVHSFHFSDRRPKMSPVC